METVKNKCKFKSIYKNTNSILSLKQPKLLYRELHLLDSYQILKTLENQEIINSAIKDAKYAKVI